MTRKTHKFNEGRTKIMTNIQRSFSALDNAAYALDCLSGLLIDTKGSVYLEPTKLGVMIEIIRNQLLDVRFSCGCKNSCDTANAEAQAMPTYASKDDFVRTATWGNETIICEVKEALEGLEGLCADQPEDRVLPACGFAALARVILLRLSQFEVGTYASELRLAK